jgi:hypothetical protein
VLRGLIASLRAVRDEARSLGVPDDFLHTLIERFVEGFRRLDGLPRDDPFWQGSNRRPTRYKMGDYCRKLAEEDPDDEQPPFMQAAAQVLVGHYFDPTTWRRLISCGRAGASWAVYAALIGVHFGGYDTAPEVMRFLQGSELCGEARPTIDALTSSEVAWVRDWAGAIADGCGGGAQLLPRNPEDRRRNRSRTWRKKTGFPVAAKLMAMLGIKPHGPHEVEVMRMVKGMKRAAERAPTKASTGIAWARRVCG